MTGGHRWQTVFPPDVYDLLQRLAAMDSANLATEVRMCILERARRRGLLDEKQTETGAGTSEKVSATRRPKSAGRP